jgi:hypothetical protein
MTYVQITPAISVALCLCDPSTVLAWGHQGHQTVDFIAASMVKGSKAERQVNLALVQYGNSK